MAHIGAPSVKKGLQRILVAEKVMLSKHAGETSPGADEDDEKAIGQGPKAISAPPTPIQSPTKRVMLLIDAKARDYALNKAIRHLRLEGSNYDVLVRLISMTGAPQSICSLLLCAWQVTSLSTWVPFCGTCTASASTSLHRAPYQRCSRREML